jgi:hypothetical protein
LRRDDDLQGSRRDDLQGSRRDDWQRSPRPTQLTYSYLVHQFREFASMIQNDQRQMTDCAALIEEMSRRASGKKSLVAYFYDETTDLTRAISTNHGPISGISKTPTIRNIKRKMSAAEHRARKRQSSQGGAIHDDVSTGVSSISPNASGTFKPPPKKRNTKLCRLCRQGGHQVARCPLVQQYGGKFLTTRKPEDSTSERSNLANSLSDPAVYTTGCRNDAQLSVVVCTSLPPIGPDGVLVIHRRVYVDVGHPNADSAENFSFECTIIQSGGETTYTSHLFELGCVRVYITKSKKSLILPLLVPSCGLLSQLSQCMDSTTRSQHDTDTDLDDTDLDSVVTLLNAETNPDADLESVVTELNAK